MHRQLDRDLVVRELVEQFEGMGLTGEIDDDDALSSHVVRKAPVGIAAIVIVGARPDVLDALLARHCPHRSQLAVADRIAHPIRRAGFSEIAIGMEKPDRAADAQLIKDACDPARQKFA